MFNCNAAAPLLLTLIGCVSKDARNASCHWPDSDSHRFTVVTAWSHLSLIELLEKWYRMNVFILFTVHVGVYFMRCMDVSISLEATLDANI